MRKLKQVPTHWIYFAIFAVSLSLNLFQAYAVSSPISQLVSDMRGYFERGLAIALGEAPKPFDSFFPAGTAYFYAALFKLFGVAHGILAIIIGQALLIAAAAVLCGFIAKELFGSQRAALFVALGSALYFPFIAQASFFMSEPLFMFCIMSSQYVLLRGAARRSVSLFLLAGLLLGFSAITKGQGVALFGANLLAFATPFLRGRLKFAPVLALGFFIVASAPFAINYSHGNQSEFYIAANDSYNLYIGQSRHNAVGCYDKDHDVFYLFYNNNWAFDPHLLPIEIVETSILNRDYFRSRTFDLWKKSPQTQLIRSAESAFEQFKLYAHWPLRNVQKLTSFDISFQIISFFLASLPALFSVVLAVIRKDCRWKVTFLLLPLAGLTAMAFLYMGQPRYLIPFKYFTFLLAVPAYQAFAAAKFRAFGLYAKELVLCILLVILIPFIRLEVHDLYVATSNPLSDGAEDHYLTISDIISPTELKLWLEFGKDSLLVSPKISAAEAAIDFTGFQVGETWPRKVHWHIGAKPQGSILLRFEPGTLSNVALFMTDGDSHWRSSKIRSEKTLLIAQSLHDGKWIRLPVSTEENLKGAKTISFDSLTGSDVSLSALVAW